MAGRTLSAEQQRNKQLEKEVAHLREVNDIIKKLRKHANKLRHETQTFN